MINRIFLLALAFFIGSTSFAQSKDEQAVATAVEALRKNMVDPNQSELNNILHDGLSYGHSGGKVEDKASFIKALTEGSSDFVTIELSEQTIHLFGKTAVVRHKLNAATNDRGVAGTVKLAIMTVWQKEGKQWKMIARQAVKLTS